MAADRVAADRVAADPLNPRDYMSLDITFDRGAVDEFAASQFLRTVREYVEEPYQWLTW